MPTQRNTSSFRRYSFHAAWLALLVLSLIDSEARADSLPASALWQPSVQVSAASHFQSTRGRSASFSTIGAQFSLERSLPASPVTAGLFADIEFTSQDSGGRFETAGGWASYGRGRWKIATSAAYFQANQRGGKWFYANTIQFEPRSGHKLAIAAIGAFGSSGFPATRLVYKTKLGPVAIAVNLGFGQTRPQDFGASTKFVWHIY